MISGLKELQELGTDSERHHWCIRNEKAMKITLGIGLVMAAGSVWFLNPVIWLFMIPLTFVALSYAAPIVRRKAKLIRIREVGLWKIFLIAAVWAGMTVILPAVEHEGLQQLQNLDSWRMTIERGIFILAITIPFDIRDLVNDAKKGVRTIPSTIGSFRAVLLSLLLLALFLFLIGWRIDLSGSLFFGYLLSTLITMLGVSYATPSRSDMFCSFWIEGTMMVQFACILLLAACC